jgi:hypothetical protein
MKKYGVNIFLMLMGALLVWSPKTWALDPVPHNDVIFSEVLQGSASSATQEFIEIYNNTTADIDLTGWHLQYASATKTDWTSPSRNITLSGSIKADDYYLLVSTGYLTDKANLSYSATLSQTGGHLRLLDKNGNLQDQIGWGSAAMPLGSAVAAPAAGSSLARLTNADGYNLSEDNSTDFAATLSPTPLADNLITLPAAEDDSSGGTGTGSGTGSGASTPPVKIDYPLVQISELLPNPASPQTDASDEFVELYNPNDYDVELSGYTITAGLRAAYKYAIKDLTIPAASYLVFTSVGTNLSLSNTAGKAQLLAPDGSLMDETDPYSSAPSGQAWIISGGVWVWTTSPTPGVDNILSVPIVLAASTKKAVTKVAKPKASKVKAAKKIKPKSTKATKPLAAATPPATAKIHPVVLAGVGSTALLYAMYEYRNDLANSVYRARRYRESRRAFWPALEAARASRVARRFGRWQNHLRARLGARFRQ